MGGTCANETAVVEKRKGTPAGGRVVATELVL